MAYEILKSIVDAEAQAVEKKRQAAEQAEQLKVKAQAEAAALLEKTRKDCSWWTKQSKTLWKTVK